MSAISVQHRKDREARPWTVRYSDGAAHRSASFRTKAEAQVFAAKIRTEQTMGEWVSPDAGRVPLERWAQEWLASYVGRARSTQERARSILRTHIVPRFGEVHLSAITRLAVERMVNEIVASGRSAATAQKALRTLSLVMGRGGRCPADPRQPLPGRQGATRRQQPRALLPHPGRGRGPLGGDSGALRPHGALRRLYRAALG